MNQTLFDHFIALVEFDQLYNKLLHERTSILKQTEDIQDQLRAAQAYLHAGANKVHELKKKVDALNLELKSCDTQKAEKKRHLDNAATPRQYQSLAQEIEALDAKRADYEEQIFDVWQELEQAQKAYDTLNKEVPARIEALENNLQALTQQIAFLDIRLEDYHKTRPGIVEIVQKSPWFAQYQSMKESVANPVVPVIKNTCTACFYSVTTQDMHNLEDDQLVQCRDCFRLLYKHKAHLADT